MDSLWRMVVLSALLACAGRAVAHPFLQIRVDNFSGQSLGWHVTFQSNDAARCAIIDSETWYNTPSIGTTTTTYWITDDTSRLAECLYWSSEYVGFFQMNVSNTNNFVAFFFVTATNLSGCSQQYGIGGLDCSGTDNPQWSTSSQYIPGAACTFQHTPSAGNYYVYIVCR